MKNNKFILFIFALLAFLGLGIGYAALTDTLTLNGTVSGTGVSGTDVESPDEQIFNFDWVEDSITVDIVQDGEREKNITVDYTFDDDILTVTIKNFAIKGENVTITIDAINNSTYDLCPQFSQMTDQNGIAGVTFRIMSTDPDYFGQAIAPGETEKIEIYYENDTTLVDEPQADRTISFKLVGTAQDPAA